MRKFLPLFTLLFVCTGFLIAENPLSAQSTVYKGSSPRQGTQEIVYITDSNYKEIINSSKPVIIDVYADWCVPCKKFAPIFEEANAKYGDRYLFAKLNSDEARSVASRFGVNSLPTVLFIKNGKEIGREVGAMSKSLFKAAIKKHLE